VKKGARVLLAWAPAVLLAPTSARAQSTRLEVDLAATRITYDTLAPLNAPSVAGLSEWQRSRLFARVSASVTGFQDAGWTLQGSGDVAGWLSPFGPMSPFHLELGGTLGAGRHSSGFDSYLTRADARLHARAGSLGAWAGASVALARNSFDSGAVRGFVPNAGAWAQTGSVRATLTFLHTSVSGEAYPEADIALTFSHGAADVSLYGGVRGSPIAGEPVERWAGVSGVYWVTGSAGVLVSGGTYSPELLQGLPGGEFISIGLRLTPRRVRPIPITAAAPIVYTADEARSGTIAFTVEGATRVDILGDWNGWVGQPLARDATGRWVLPPGVPPGVHRFNLRVDGDRWIVPEGVPSVDDGFGGRAGLLVVSPS